MKRREAKFSILFRHWIMANPQVSCTFEMKDTRGKDYLPFSEVKEHQIDYGLAIKGQHGVLMRVQGINGEPDYSYFRNAPAWVVIKYPKFFCIVDVEKFHEEHIIYKQKSLSIERARRIAREVVDL